MILKGFFETDVDIFTNRSLTIWWNRQFTTKYM